MQSQQAEEQVAGDRDSQRTLAPARLPTLSSSAKATLPTVVALGVELLRAWQGQSRYD